MVQKKLDKKAKVNFKSYGVTITGKEKIAIYVW